MTFLTTKKNILQLTFIVQAEIQVQEVSPKEKERKRNVNDVPNSTKNTPQLTFIIQVEIQVQEASPKEEKEKGTLMTFPMTKKNTHPAYLYSPSRNPGPGSVL